MEEAPRRGHAQIRQTTNQLVLGSRMLSTKLPDSDQSASFYGWPVLALSTLSNQHTEQEERESRIAFANWSWRQMPMPPIVILRSIYWSYELTEKMSLKQGQLVEPSPLAIPARFVWIPLEQVQAWIRGFERLQVPVRDPSGANDRAAIRVLRIDLSWITNVLEKRWQARDTDHAPLNQYWEQVWEEMSVALDDESALADMAAIHEGDMWGHRKTTLVSQEGPYPYVYDSDEYAPRRLIV